MKILPALLIMASAACFQAGAQINVNDFRCKVDITFSGSGIAPENALTNFPALVRLSETSLPGFLYADFTSSDGADLRFTDASGAELPYEIDTWNPAGESLVWVRVPELHSNATITACWGGSDTTAPAYTGTDSTWANGYIAVWHFSGDATTAMRDSSTNGNHFTTVTGTVGLGAGHSADGAVGNVVSLVAGRNCLVAPNNASFSGMEALTIEMLAYDAGNTDATVYGLLSKRQKSANQVAYGLFHMNAKVNIDIGSGNNTRTDAGAIPSFREWHHIAVVFDGSQATLTDRLKYYEDATAATFSPASAIPARVPVSTSPLYLGILDLEGTEKRSWNGALDEVRLSNIARSPAWLAASRATMAPGSSFAVYDEVKYVDIPEPVVATLEADVLLHTVTLNGRLVYEGTSQPVITTYWGRVNGETNPSAWEHARGHAAMPVGDIIDTLVPGVDFYYTQDYYFRHHAQNSASNAWSAITGSFCTLGAAIIGEPSAAFAVDTATFSIPVLSTGAAPVTVTCYVGTDPGQLTSIGSLTTTDEQQTLDFPHSGFSVGAILYYAFAAQNTMPDALATVCTVHSATNSIATTGATQWIGGGGEDTGWYTAANWDNGVPGVNATARFPTPGHTATSAVDAVAGDLVVQCNGDIGLDFTGAALATPNGINIGSNSTVNLTLAGTFDATPGVLRIGVPGSGNALTLAPGSRLSAGRLFLGYTLTSGTYAENNRIIISNGSLLAVTGTVTVSTRVVDAHTRNNTIEILPDGVLTARGINLGPGGGSSDSASGHLLVDGGIVTNTGALNFGNPFGSGHTMLLANGSRLRQTGDVNLGQRAPNSRMTVTSGSTADVTGAFNLGYYGDHARAGSLVVSNASLIVSGAFQVGDKSIAPGNTILLWQDGGEPSSAITIGGEFRLGNTSRDNILHIHSSALTAATVTLGNSATSTNNTIRLSGPTARLRANTLNLRNKSVLAFDIPATGFDNNDPPIFITGNATIENTTRIEITPGDFIGRAILLEAGGDLSTLSEENFTFNLKPGRRAKPLFDEPGKITVKIYNEPSYFMVR